MDDGGIDHDGWTDSLRSLAAVTMLGLVVACKPPSDARWPADPAAAKRGLSAIERVQCGACHDIPGVRWPKGRTGPSLHDFHDRGLIAGALPNRPDILARFVRNAPAVKPGSPMPPMPVTDAEAIDIAAYLYEVGQ